MTTGTNGRRITTHEATVKTAAVEVKTLTISGKQVTLAVFRQLKCEDLMDYATAALRGVPWGTVNYHFDGCAYSPDKRQGDCYFGEHFHVVWQLGNELRQSPVFAVRERNHHRENEVKERLIQLDTRGVSIARTIFCQRVVDQNPLTLHADGERYSISDERRDGVTWHVMPPSGAGHYLEKDREYELQPRDISVTRLEALASGVEIPPISAGEPHYFWIKETPTMVQKRLDKKAQSRLTNLHSCRDECVKRAELQDAPETWVALLGDVGQAYKKVQAEYKAAVAAEDQIMARYEAQRQALEALDQLFIAV